MHPCTSACINILQPKVRCFGVQRGAHLKVLEPVGEDGLYVVFTPSIRGPPHVGNCHISLVITGAHWQYSWREGVGGPWGRETWIQGGRSLSLQPKPKNYNLQVGLLEQNSRDNQAILCLRECCKHIFIQCILLADVTEQTNYCKTIS